MKRSSTAPSTPKSNAKRPTAMTSTPKPEAVEASANSPSVPPSNKVAAIPTQSKDKEDSAPSGKIDSVQLLSDEVAAFRAKVICHLMTPATMAPGGTYGYRDFDKVASYLKEKFEAIMPRFYDSGLETVSVDNHHLKSWESTVVFMSSEDQNAWQALVQKAESDGTSKRPISPEYTTYLAAQQAMYQEKQVDSVADTIKRLCDDALGKRANNDAVLSESQRKRIPTLIGKVWERTRNREDWTKIYRNEDPVKVADIKRLVLEVWLFGIKDQDVIMARAARKWCETMGLDYDRLMGSGAAEEGVEKTE